MLVGNIRTTRDDAGRREAASCERDIETGDVSTPQRNLPEIVAAVLQSRTPMAPRITRPKRSEGGFQLDASSVVPEGVVAHSFDASAGMEIEHEPAISRNRHPVPDVIPPPSDPQISATTETASPSQPKKLKVNNTIVSYSGSCEPLNTELWDISLRI